MDMDGWRVQVAIDGARDAVEAKSDGRGWGSSEQWGAVRQR